MKHLTFLFSLAKRVRVVLASAAAIFLFPLLATGDELIDAALAHPDRPAADVELDAKRKPGEVLEFLGIGAGMSVFDVNSGGGYYTELAHRIVGPGGHVVAHNAAAVADVFSKDAIAERYKLIRLPGVTRIVSEFKNIDLGEEQHDLVLFVLSYHDVYHSHNDEQYVWPKADAQPFLKAIYAGVKPGGVVGVVDHADGADAPTENVSVTHRISPAVVQRDFEDAGFVLEAEADFLRNPDDDYSMSVFAPEIRRQTDRFVMRFRKPE